MERHDTQAGVIELGTASTATKGQPIGNTPEPQGLYFKVLPFD